MHLLVICEKRNEYSEATDIHIHMGSETSI